MPRKIGRFTFANITSIVTTSHTRHSIEPGDARTFANPTCSASARLGNFYSTHVCDFVLLCLVAVVFMRFLPAIYRRGVRYRACSCFYFISHFFYFSAAEPSRCFSLCLFFFFLFFSLISLIAGGPHRYHPARGHKGSSHLSPLHALQFFIAMQVQHSYNLSTNG